MAYGTLKYLILAGLYTLPLSVLAEQGHSHDDIAEKFVVASTEKNHEEHDDHDREHEEEIHDGEHAEEAGVKLSVKQMALANIQVQVLNKRLMDYQVYAPGEIKANGYTSYLVSPRVDSVVLRRHAALGDHVEKGQPLVTLFSESVAQAQGAFRIASLEWQRIQKMKRKDVSEKNVLQAQTDYQAAYGQLLAFGLSKKAIESLSKKSQALGEYTLIAENSGGVLSDDFRQGQRVESGQALMELADEHQLWVEARLAPTPQLDIPMGTKANVKVGSEWYVAKVTQQAHTIDPLTRTRIVRLLVDNDGHKLHPGLFADVNFIFSSQNPVMAVSESALMRSSDGDWTVFVETHPGQFEAQEVELGKTFVNAQQHETLEMKPVRNPKKPQKKWREISGLKPGSRVVMQGAFFVASQIAKGGFDPHNH